MHIVVVGCGRVGSELAASLEGDGHSVAVVDKRSTSFARLPAGFGGRTIEGYGFDRATLIAAGIEEAAALGIGGVPFFVFNQKIAVPGAESVETLIEAMTKASA